MKFTDLSGKTFGYLTVIERAGSDSTGKNSTWLCRCKCGNTKIVNRSVLTRNDRKGHISSCGCRTYESKNYTHGMSKTRIYHEWLSMRKRCSRAIAKDYDSYEGRGITVCDEWNNDFISFYEWAMNNGYDDSLTIDRVDVEKGYSPENCRWITIESQQSNKRNTVRINYEGEEWCLRTLCMHIGFPYKTANARYIRMKRRGESITPEKLFKPINTDKISSSNQRRSK